MQFKVILLDDGFSLSILFVLSNPLSLYFLDSYGCLCCVKSILKMSLQESF